MIVYDKHAFDEAGVPYPGPGWSWDDFLTKARALTVREGEEVTRWGFVQTSVTRLKHSLPFIEGRAGSLIDQTTDPPTPRLDQPEVVAALQWYVDLYLKEDVAPYLGPAAEGIEHLGTEIAALIGNGQAAMWNQSFYYWSWRKEQENQGVVPYPVDRPDSKTTPVQVQGLTMSAGTQHPAAAWRWMDHVSRQALDDPGISGSLLPARRSAAEASGFWDKIDQELVHALRYAIEHSYVSHRSEGTEAATEALEAILAEKKSVQDAADEAQARAEAEIRGETAQQVEATPVLAFAVAAPEEQEPSAEGLVTIVFTPGPFGSAYLKAYRDVAEQFHETHPDVQVEVKRLKLTGTYMPVQAIAEKTDCFQSYPDVYSSEWRAAVLSLEPFLEADPAFSTDDFYPPLLDSFTYQGQLWGLPSQFSPIVMEYNKELFDAAGVDYPPLNWTTGDFLELAVALTQGEGGKEQYGFVPDVLELSVLLEMIARLGAQLVDENANPPALSFTDPTTVEAVRWYASLSTEFGVKPVFLTDSADLAESASFCTEWDRLVNGGRAAMWINFTGAGNKPDGPNIGVTTLPTGTDSTGNAGSIDGYFISSPAARGSSSTPDTRQACWQWITFLTAQPGLVEGLPARRSVAESAAFRQRVGARRATVYRASLADEEGTSGPNALRSDAWLTHSFVWLGRAYSQIVKGEASVEEALNAAQKLADDYRACVIVKDAFDDLDELRACLKQVDPTLLGFFFDSDEGE